MRYVESRDYRRGDETGYGISDGMFMTSRDGLSFHRWDESFIRPGLQRERWVTRNNLAAHGLVFTKSDVHGGPELSLYSTEGYWEGDACRLRRYTIRLDGFVSVRAGSAGGEMVTKPLRFTGAKLQLNNAGSSGSCVPAALGEGNLPFSGAAVCGFRSVGGDRLFARASDWANLPFPRLPARRRLSVAEA